MASTPRRPGYPHMAWHEHDGVQGVMGTALLVKSYPRRVDVYATAKRVLRAIRRCHGGH